MDGYSLAEVAERAGTTPGFVETLVDGGLIERGERYDVGAVRRAMLLSACVDAGLTVEALAAAKASGHLDLSAVDGAHYAQWGHRLDRTWERLAAEEGLELGFVREAFHAAGLGPIEAEGSIREDDPAILRAFGVAVQAGWDPATMLRIARVYGESLRRIARTETELWHENVDVPLERQGAPQRDVMSSSREVGESIMAVTDAMLLAIYHRMEERAWIGDLVEHIELSLVEAGVYEKPERPCALAFMDVSGYTMLTEERGDHAAADVASSLAGIVQRAAASHGGEVLKWLGDGVMLRFDDPSAGVHSSLSVVGATLPAGLPPAHVGMAVGAVVERDGDVFGRTVNLAARISGVAGPGEVLVTAETVDAVTDGSLTFSPYGDVPLKGMAAPVTLFRAGAA
jgi:class 3 adenylate cyclase